MARLHYRVGPDGTKPDKLVRLPLTDGFSLLQEQTVNTDTVQNMSIMLPSSSSNGVLASVSSLTSSRMGMSCGRTCKSSVPRSGMAS